MQCNCVFMPICSGRGSRKSLRGLKIGFVECYVHITNIANFMAAGLPWPYLFDVMLCVPNNF